MQLLACWARHLGKNPGETEYKRNQLYAGEGGLASRYLNPQSRLSTISDIPSFPCSPTMAPIGTILRQIYPPTPKWSVDKIPDLPEKVFIVTGGNTGIGKETCKQLLLKNAKVYLAARSESKAQTAIDELEKETGKKAIFLKLDLSDLDATKKSAQEFLE